MDMYYFISFCLFGSGILVSAVVEYFTPEDKQ